MYHQLTEPERYTLSLLKREGRSLRSIARLLQRSPSTISREVRRNATVDHYKPRPLYVPSKAQEHANGRRRRSRRVKQHASSVYQMVEELLEEEQWSPEQISNWAADNEVASISHMTIYRHIQNNARQGGRLKSCLRQGGKRRRKRTFGPENRGRLQGKPMIDTRPEAIEAREEIGHWEGDTVMGSASERDCLLTLVERSTGLALVAKLPHRTTTAVNRAALKLIDESELPFKTITWDNGTEFHGYKALEQAAEIRCYFAYPHRPWERGSNENLNGLLRQYFPKRRSLAKVRQDHCDTITHKLNHRPRKRYDYKTPFERLEELRRVLHFAC